MGTPDGVERDVSLVEIVVHAFMPNQYIPFQNYKHEIKVTRPVYTFTHDPFFCVVAVLAVKRF